MRPNAGNGVLLFEFCRHRRPLRPGVGCQRVAIWDFDAHHGNGTEAIVSGNKRIRLASVHQYPGYPGTGGISHANSFNWPIPPRTDPKSMPRPSTRHLIAYSNSVRTLIGSAGFDAFIRDPLTEMTLEQEDFASFGRRLNETGLASGCDSGGRLQ